MGARPCIAVVVLTWNDGPLLDRCLASVRASEGVDVELVVVDNGSTPPAAVPGSLAATVVRNDENRGVAPGRNQGVAASRADLVCLLDSDAVVGPSALRRMADVLAADDRIALVAPVFEDQAPEASAGRAPSLVRKLGRAVGWRTDYAPGPGGPAPLRRVDFAIGACQLFRRQAFEAVGGLDETYFYGPEDVDFCLRLRLAGWEIVQVGDAPVRHPPRRRNRRLLTRRGIDHGRAVARHLWRHRHFARVAPR